MNNLKKIFLSSLEQSIKNGQGQTVTVKQVFIVSRHRMFAYGLKSLLRQKKEIEVVGQETDIKRAIEKIEELQPDVVILDGDESLESSLAVIIRILKEKAVPKIIGLNLQDNTIFVYQAKHWIAKNVEDLMVAIENDPSQSSDISVDRHI